jgi:dehydrodolichyl diphosphate syntase complex subunit NUS1
MVASQETKVYRQDARSKGILLSPKQREEMLNPYLPTPLSTKSQASAPQKRMLQPLQDFLKQQLHLLIFTIIHTLFSVYIRIRQTYHVLLDRVFAILYYHHRAPELIRQDVKNLSRIPEHLSVILELKGEERGTAGLEALMDEVAEIAAWCSCVGIPMLSVYEKTGMAPLPTRESRKS